MTLIRVEGFMGVGKTLIGKEVAALMSAEFIDGDEFADAADEERPYIACLRLNDLRDAVEREMRSRRVVFAAVCSQEVLPQRPTDTEFSVYLKRLSFSVPSSPYWHVDPDAEERPSRALEASIYDYHLRVRPHLHADLILDIPEEGYCLDGPLA